jgi:hypothetical protein
MTSNRRSPDGSLADLGFALFILLSVAIVTAVLWLIFDRVLRVETDPQGWPLFVSAAYHAYLLTRA